MILVNFKLYEKTLGEYSVELAKLCFEVGVETGLSIIPIVSPFFVDRIFRETGKKPWIGHVDMFAEGKKTGYISAPCAFGVGADGSLINHSEHGLSLGVIANTLGTLPEGMKSLVCVKSLGQMERFSKKLAPNYFAYEPPYLIASKDASVASERIEVFEKIVNIGKEKGVEVLAGAGVKDKKDVEAVLQAGGKGVLLSSQVVLSSDPRAVLLDLASGFKV